MNEDTTSSSASYQDLKILEYPEPRCRKLQNQNCGFRASGPFSLAGGSLYPKSSAGKGGVDKMADQIHE